MPSTLAHMSGNQGAQTSGKLTGDAFFPYLGNTPTVTLITSPAPTMNENTSKSVLWNLLSKACSPSPASSPSLRFYICFPQGSPSDLAPAVLPRLCIALNAVQSEIQKPKALAYHSLKGSAIAPQNQSSKKTYRLCGTIEP